MSVYNLCPYYSCQNCCYVPCPPSKDFPMLNSDCTPIDMGHGISSSCCGGSSNCPPQQCCSSSNNCGSQQNNCGSSQNDNMSRCASAVCNMPCPPVCSAYGSLAMCPPTCPAKPAIIPLPTYHNNCTLPCPLPCPQERPTSSMQGQHLKSLPLCPQKCSSTPNHLKCCKSYELIGGKFILGCDCVKHNGLQDDCRRTECRWAPPFCRSRPWAACRPGVCKMCKVAESRLSLKKCKAKLSIPKFTINDCSVNRNKSCRES